MTKDEMLEKVSAGDEASVAARKASRFSETHWKLIYLLQNPDNVFDGYCIDKRGTDALFLIPSIDMQATIKNCDDVNLNDKVELKVSDVDIPNQKVLFHR